jgi:hypothetical protein
MDQGNADLKQEGTAGRRRHAESDAGVSGESRYWIAEVS